MLLIARALLRRRWPALIALGLVAGLAGATVTAAAAIARRTGTAYDRLAAATAPGDVTMFVLAGDEAATRVSELPSVARVWRARAGVAAIGDSTNYVGLTAAPEAPPGLVRPIAIAGRLPDPAASNEVVIHEQFARALGELRGGVIGERLPLHFLTGDDFRNFDTGFGSPHGPAVEVTVVGVVRIAGRAEGLFSMLAGPGFAAAHPDAFIAPALNLELENGASGVPAFLDDLEVLEAELEPTGEGAEEFEAFDFEVVGAARSEVDATAGALVTGLVVFAAVAGAVGLVVVGQAFARYHAATAHEQQIESSLGLTRFERAGARALAATPAAALAAIVTTAGAAIAGSRDPIGALARYEPHPGKSLNVAVAMVGGVLTAVVVVAAAGITAWLAGRTTARARMAARASRLGGQPAAMGVRLALGAGTDSAARPARTGLAGLIVGIVGITGALTFSASLTRVVDTPPRYGWSGDFAVVDSRPDIDRELLADPRIVAATRYLEAPGRVDGRADATPLVAARHLRGHAGWWMVEGRGPNSDQEVTVGLRLADDLDVGVGDTITMRQPEGGGRRELTVVGTGVDTPLSNENFGSNLLVTPRALDRIAHAQPFSQTVARAAPGVDTDELVDEYAARYEVTEAAPPREVDNLRELDRLPAVLGGFLAIVGLAALSNAIVLAVRRRGRDLAVLRVMGYTPVQTATAVLTMATVAGAIALAIGVPLGIAAGRALWGVVAQGASVEGDALVPTGWTLAISAGVLVAAVLVALLPARRAATFRLTTLLRAE